MLAPANVGAFQRLATKMSSSLPGPLRFLVIDHHQDSRFLLVKSVLRKFPQALIEEVADGEPALALAAAGRFDAIITHRTIEYFGAELVEKLRAQNPNVPIVMVSSIDRAEAALAAGADGFLLYDEWLRIGSVVKELLEKGRPPSKSQGTVPQAAPAEVPKP